MAPLGASRIGLMSPSGFKASGGTESSYGDYKVHTFLTGDDFIVSGGEGTVDMLIVAGGGGGGGIDGDYHEPGGGAGAGGMRAITGITVTPKHMLLM